MCLWCSTSGDLLELFKNTLQLKNTCFYLVITRVSCFSCFSISFIFCHFSYAILVFFILLIWCTGCSNVEMLNFYLDSENHKMLLFISDLSLEWMGLQAKDEWRQYLSLFIDCWWIMVVIHLICWVVSLLHFRVSFSGSYRIWIEFWGYGLSHDHFSQIFKQFSKNL